MRTAIGNHDKPSEFAREPHYRLSVISGAEKTIQSLWGLSPELHGIAMASALYGTVVGSLIGGWPTDVQVSTAGGVCGREGCR